MWDIREHGTEKKEEVERDDVHMLPFKKEYVI